MQRLLYEINQPKSDFEHTVRFYAMFSSSLLGYPDQQRWRDLDPGVRPQDLHLPHRPGVHGEAAAAGADLG